MPKNSTGRARVLYMGTPEFALAPLEALLRAGHEIVAIVSSPDRPAGRGLKMRTPPVAEFAKAHSLLLLQPADLKDPQLVDKLKGLKPDIGVVVAFRKLPKSIWSIPPLGFFNLHASLLPAYRGAAPINWALINGEKESGVTTFMLNEGIDTGGILLQKAVAITPDDSAGTLHDKLAQTGAELVVETVQGLLDKTVHPHPQPTAGSFPLAPKFFRADCRIDWCWPADAVHNRIRGLSPQPGAWCDLQRGEELIENVKIYESKLCDAPATGGEAGEVHEGESLEVTCGDGKKIAIVKIQMPGKRMIDARDFMRGYSGERLQFL